MKTPSHNLPAFRKNLLDWYSRHKRALPWRENKDPYRVWLSEIMLQQTTVKTVIPYFLKFLEKYPDLHAFSKADEPDYLKAWQGLGYYNRVRQFHKAVKLLVSDFKGRIPSTKAELLTLPGLGAYTAAAVASIAFDQPEAVVDGNVIRVLSRLFAVKEDVALKSTRDFFQKKADEILEKKRPGDFNQAMMELGATVCTPKNPSCLLCPVKAHCLALKAGCPEQFPVKAAKAVYVTTHWNCHIVVKAGKALLVQRQKNPMKGMWEFPLSPIQTPPETKPIHHSIMQERLRVYPVIETKGLKKFDSLKPHQWVSFDDLSHFPLTTLTRKTLKKIILPLN